MSRRQKRYERRKAKREETKRQYEKYDNFENVASLSSLYHAAWKASNGVRWKASTQRFLINLLFRIHETRKKLLAEKDIRKGFICFDINERGKVRHIKSVHFSERIVQKSLCTNVLYPALTKNLIYENSASQKKKGTLFATKIVEKQLRKHYKKYGNAGYILMIDFQNYFKNIEHNPLIELYKKTFKDKKLINLSIAFIKAFGDKGLGLGSETSQINAVAYPNVIDHYIKSFIKSYSRYMDDSPAISNSKEQLKDLLEKIKPKYDELGIKLNIKKTHVAKLKNGFVFLKTRFILTNSGKIIKKPCRNSITRERQKLKKQIKLFNKGLITKEEIKQSYESWAGSMLRRNARKTVYEMNKLYKQVER